MAKKARPETIPAAAQPGTVGEDVSALQQALSDAGHYSGEVSGIYDEPTREAVLKLQESFGDAFTGKKSGVYTPLTASTWEASGEGK